MCPTLSKKWYRDRKTAKKAAIRIQQKHSGRRLRHYRCECGGFHLTSQKSR